jgi:hypothetical protein
MKINTYQLLQIPAADLHIALVLIQAFCKLLRISITASHTQAVLLALIILSSDSLLLFGCSAGSTTEESAECVSN